ncbi:receptor-type tyrosine-protein phosphatase V-like [Pelodytes ibericus]
MTLRKWHRPIPILHFPQVFEEKEKFDGFQKEFEELKEVGNNQPKMEAELPVNATKNRYPHILPYDHSRVRLKQLLGDSNSGYINANYIPGFHGVNEYIATQAPTPASVIDFWRMIWEQRVKTIIMLTVCKENGKILCEQYWPSDTASFGPFTVCCIEELHCKEWTTRHFTLHHGLENQMRRISQIHFMGWPDRGIPQTPASLVAFVDQMREQVQAVDDCGPTVLHCSAGVGRTGTLIALDVALQQLRDESCIDVFNTVYQMRLNRYMMLQTLDQYIFVHRCILEKILQMENKDPKMCVNGYPVSQKI